MNLKQLEAFIKVSDSKSFSKAAQELYLTQPTVSAHIQTLEKELKVRLFVRNTKTVKLSEDGKTLYQYARQMIELEQEIQSMFSKAAEQKDLKWLEGEPLIIREEGSGTRKEAEKQLKKMGISLDDLNIVATIENPEAVKRSVKSGLGITIISRLAAADEIESGEVLEFPFSQDGSGRNLNLVYNKNYKLPAAAEHVRELIIEKYELQKQSLQ